MTSGWVADVVRFWFALKPERWWRADESLDQRIRQNFCKAWADKRQLPVDAFVGGPLTALAAVILFDQFPRNMFRGAADQFASDHLALAIARDAVDRKLDDELAPIERNFLYMPFQHSENLDDQNRAVLLQSATGDENFAEAARKHRNVIEKFGRFPHRNAILNRTPRPAELAAGDVMPW